MNRGKGRSELELPLLTFVGDSTYRQHHPPTTNHVKMAIEQEKDKSKVHKLSLKGELSCLISCALLTQLQDPQSWSLNS